MLFCWTTGRGLLKKILFFIIHLKHAINVCSVDSCTVCTVLFSGLESRADLPRDSNALLRQETWSFKVRLLFEWSRDQRSGPGHHLRYFCTLLYFWCIFKGYFNPNFHCFMKGRFWKCWRKKTRPFKIWSLPVWTQCKFVASFMLHHRRALFWEWGLDMILYFTGSVMLVGMSFGAILEVDRGVTSIMSSLMPPSICLERRWKNLPTRLSGEFPSVGFRMNDSCLSWIRIW